MQTKNLAEYIRTCEADRAVGKACDNQLTRCEFNRSCSSKVTSFVYGLLVGAATVFVVDRIK